LQFGVGWRRISPWISHLISQCLRYHRLDWQKWCLIFIIYICFLYSRHWGVCDRSKGESMKLRQLLIIPKDKVVQHYD
jgi:hypothetical protein